MNESRKPEAGMTVTDSFSEQSIEVTGNTVESVMAAGEIISNRRRKG